MGKSEIPKRVAIATGRHLVTIDLMSHINSRTSIYRALSSVRCTATNIVFNPNNSIYVFDELDGAVKYMLDSEQSVRCEGKKKDDDSTKLKIKDLLSIFQGTGSANGRIIFATTNDVEFLESAMPNLTRTGRLTRVHMSFIGWPEIQRMYRDYYGVELSLEQRRAAVPTSDFLYRIQTMNKCAFKDWVYEEATEALGVK